MQDYALDRRQKPAPIPTGFSTILLATNPQGAQRPAASKSLAKDRASQPERQKPNAGKTQRKGCDASPRAKAGRLAEPSRRGRRHAKSSSLQFQERGLSSRQFQMRAWPEDSAAQSCLGNGRQAAL